ncbi:hypothetical protein KA977_02485 [Candidatus Dependentiae bacterium]|nr:hypothetical protein [Candidatus Dependentiae bacterium]
MKKETPEQSLKEIICYKSIPDKFIIQYFDVLDSEISADETPYIEQLLAYQKPDIQISIIKYIQRTGSIAALPLLLKLINSMDTKFYIKMESLLVLSKLDRKGKAKHIIEKLIEKISFDSVKSDNKIQNISAEKINTIIIESLNETLKIHCGIDIQAIKVRQTDEITAAGKYTLWSNSEQNLDCRVLFNFSEDTGIKLTEYLYKTESFKYEKVPIDDYGIIYNSIEIFNLILEKITMRLAKENIIADFSIPKNLKFKDITLAEKADTVFLYEINSLSGRLLFIFTIYEKNSSRIDNLTEVTENLRIYYIESDKQQSQRNKFEIKCGITGLTIEDSGLKNNFEKAMESRIIIDSSTFQKIKKLYDSFISDFDADHRVTMRLSLKIDFLVKTCDLLKSSLKDIVIFKINQVNPQFGNIICDKLIDETFFLKLSEISIKKIIDRLDDMELSIIILFFSPVIKNKVIGNCSNSKFKAINDFINDSNFKLINPAKINKTKDKLISFIKEIYLSDDKCLSDMVNQITRNL